MLRLPRNKLVIIHHLGTQVLVGQDILCNTHKSGYGCQVHKELDYLCLGPTGSLDEEGLNVSRAHTWSCRSGPCLEDFASGCPSPTCMAKRPKTSPLGMNPKHSMYAYIGVVSGVNVSIYGIHGVSGNKTTH